MSSYLVAQYTSEHRNHLPLPARQRHKVQWLAEREEAGLRRFAVHPQQATMARWGDQSSELKPLVGEAVSFSPVAYGSPSLPSSRRVSTSSSTAPASLLDNPNRTLSRVFRFLCEQEEKARLAEEDARLNLDSTAKEHERVDLDSKAKQHALDLAMAAYWKAHDDLTAVRTLIAAQLEKVEPEPLDQPPSSSPLKVADPVHVSSYPSPPPSTSRATVSPTNTPKQSQAQSAPKRIRSDVRARKATSVNEAAASLRASRRLKGVPPSPTRPTVLTPTHDTPPARQPETSLKITIKRRKVA